VARRGRLARRPLRAVESRGPARVFSIRHRVKKMKLRQRQNLGVRVGVAQEEENLGSLSGHLIRRIIADSGPVVVDSETTQIPSPLQRIDAKDPPGRPPAIATLDYQRRDPKQANTSSQFPIPGGIISL
jgi:hypothetical protein